MSYEKRTPLDDAKLTLAVTTYWNNLYCDFTGKENKEWKKCEKDAETKVAKEEYCELEEKYNKEEHGPIDQLEI